jgi:uncharacterized repeat protein (TIGR04076 family)
MKIQITVRSILKGECPQGIKVGDTWLINNERTPGGMCQLAYNSLSPALFALRYGGVHPWGDDENNTYIACPDPRHVVIYELRKIT